MNGRQAVGVSGVTLLGIAFVVLKLCGVIDWSWWWVTAPFWGGFVIVVFFALIFLILVLASKSWE